MDVPAAVGEPIIAYRVSRSRRAPRPRGGRFPHQSAPVRRRVRTGSRPARLAGVGAAALTPAHIFATGSSVILARCFIGLYQERVGLHVCQVAL